LQIGYNEKQLNNHHMRIDSALKKTIAGLILLILIIEGCKSHPQPKIEVKIEPPAAAVEDLTEDQVIQKMKDELYRSRKSIPIQARYWESEMKRVPCTQYDVDLNVRCSEPQPPGAPYGYKNVPQQSLKCCREKKLDIYNIPGKWEANYSQQEDQWTVTFRFNAENLNINYE